MENQEILLAGDHFSASWLKVSVDRVREAGPEKREDVKRKSKGVEMAEVAKAHVVYNPVPGAEMFHVVYLQVIGTKAVRSMWTEV